MVAAKSFRAQDFSIQKAETVQTYLLLRQLSTYDPRIAELNVRKNKNGALSEDEFSIDPHTLSAIWYALDDYDAADLKDASQKRRRPNRERRR